jgi:hypothetical protein
LAAACRFHPDAKDRVAGDAGEAIIGSLVLHVLEQGRKEKELDEDKHP